MDACATAAWLGEAPHPGGPGSQRPVSLDGGIAVGRCGQGSGGVAPGFGDLAKESGEQVELPFVDDATCDEVYPGQESESEICAGDMANGGVDSCWSDSGGPLFRRDDEGEWIQVGIVSHSRTPSCGLPGSPSVYTEVSTFHDEIAKVAAELDS